MVKLDIGENAFNSTDFHVYHVQFGRYVVFVVVFFSQLHTFLCGIKISVC